jgi:uncharacterized integral membrane protein
MSREEPDSPAIADPTPEGKISLLAKLRIGLLLVAAVVVIIVATLNWTPITIDLMGRDIEIALSLLVILTFVCGTIFGVLLINLRPRRKHD